MYRVCLDYTEGYSSASLNPLPVKLFNLNFHPLEVVSRRRDPQLQVKENYSDLTNLEVEKFKIVLLNITFYL